MDIEMIKRCNATGYVTFVGDFKGCIVSGKVVFPSGIDICRFLYDYGFGCRRQALQT